MVKLNLNRTRSNWQNWVIFGGIVVITMVAFWMLWSYALGWLNLGSVKTPLDLDQTKFTEETGVRISLLAITAGGGMIDLRYQIVDPDKSVVVHDLERPPTITDEQSGSSIARPWHEHAHDQDLHTAVTYYELILNPDGLIKPGNTVTIQIGDAILEHVPVQ